jgi:hypothetical protein
MIESIKVVCSICLPLSHVPYNLLLQTLYNVALRRQNNFKPKKSSPSSFCACVCLLIVTQKFQESIPHPTTIVAHIPFLNQTRSVYSVFLPQHQKNTNKKTFPIIHVLCRQAKEVPRRIVSLLPSLISPKKKKKLFIYTKR